MDRLNPKHKGNSRFLFIDDDNNECDICDEKVPCAIFTTIGGGKYHIRICKSCLKETIKRF